MKNINVLDLKRRLQLKDITLLDVREGYELEIASIKNCIHIPMMEIPKRVSELGLKKDIAVICHSGVRSAQVCSFLEKKGYSVFNVTGGINMWSVKVDIEMNRY